MPKKYNEKFKRDIVRTFESLKPKPKQAEFAKQHQLNLHSFQNWLSVFRESTTMWHHRITNNSTSEIKKA